jgi:hypothetical protein
MTAQHFLMLLHLTVQLVDQQIDGGIHVAIFAIGKQFPAIDVELGFGFLTQFFDAEDDMDVVDMVEMTIEFFEFVVDEAAQGVSDLDMMAGQVDLHSGFLIQRQTDGRRSKRSGPSSWLLLQHGASPGAFQAQQSELLAEL